MGEGVARFTVEVSTPLVVGVTSFATAYMYVGCKHKHEQEDNINSDWIA